eukprot:6211053-Pleurochrysis_carterae.AAC.1
MSRAVASAAAAFRRVDRTMSSKRLEWSSCLSDREEFHCEDVNKGGGAYWWKEGLVPARSRLKRHLSVASRT